MDSKDVPKAATSSVKPPAGTPERCVGSAPQSSALVVIHNESSAPSTPHIPVVEVPLPAEPASPQPTPMSTGGGTTADRVAMPQVLAAPYRRDTAMFRSSPATAMIPASTATAPQGRTAPPPSPAATPRVGSTTARVHSAVPPTANAPGEGPPAPPVPPAYEQAKKEFNYIGKELEDMAPIWRVYRNEITAHDKDVSLDGWNKTLDILLIFAGLFSAVVTTFVVATYPMLQTPNADQTAVALYAIALSLNNTNVLRMLDLAPPSKGDQPTTTIRAVNALWFSSLFISLAVAFLSILAKQWLVEYTNRMSAPVKVSRSLGGSDGQDKHATAAASAASRSWASRRQFFFKGLEDWHVSAFVTQFLPFLLHVGLFLFLAGLAMLLLSLDRIVATIFLVLTGLLGAFYLACITVPILRQDCPSIPLVNRLVILVPIAFLNVCSIVLAILRSIRARRRHGPSTDPESGAPSGRQPATTVSTLIAASSKRVLVAFEALWRTCVARLRTRWATLSLEQMSTVLSDRRRNVVPKKLGAPKDDVEILTWLLLDSSTENATLIAFQAIGAFEPEVDLRKLHIALEGITAGSLLGDLSSTTITATDIVRVLRSELRLRQQLPLDLSQAMLGVLRKSGLPDAQLLFAALSGIRKELRANILNWAVQAPSSSVVSTAALIGDTNAGDFVTRAYCNFLLQTSKGSRCTPDVYLVIWFDAESAQDDHLRARILIAMHGWGRDPNEDPVWLNGRVTLMASRIALPFMTSNIWLDKRVLPNLDVGKVVDTITVGYFQDRLSAPRWVGAMFNLLRMLVACRSDVVLFKALEAVVPDLTPANPGSDGAEIANCIFMLVARKTQLMLELLRTRTEPCPLAHTHIRERECELHCIPSFIVRLLDHTGQTFRALATCAIIRVMSLCAGSAKGSVAFWLPMEDDRVVRFLSISTQPDVCAPDRLDHDHRLVEIMSTMLPEVTYHYCRTFNNLPVSFGLQDFITQQVSVAVNKLVTDGVEGSARETADLPKILAELVVYFVREATINWSISAPWQTAPCINLATAIRSALSLLSDCGEDVAELERTFRDGVRHLLQTYPTVFKEEVWAPILGEGSST